MSNDLRRFCFEGSVKFLRFKSIQKIAQMTAENIYWYASVLIFAPWALLIFAPKWRYTEWAAFAAAFVLLVAGGVFTWKYMTSAEVGGSLLSLEGLKNLFRSQDMLLTGWLNYLSFSLFTGIWQASDARAEKIPHIFVVPSLLATMLAGPTGLLVDLVIRWVKTRKWQVH